MIKKSIHFIRKYILYLALIQALAATAGSLIASEIMHVPICILCWYQRILMYPLVFILVTGILIKDKKVHLYVLPLSITGMAVAFYHLLLQVKIIPESVAPCVKGISCSEITYTLFGFVTIPLLSFLAFAIITSIMVIYSKICLKKQRS